MDGEQARPVASAPVLPVNGGGLPRRRVAAGLLLVLLGLPSATAVLVQLRGSLARESALLVLMLIVVLAAVIGGALPGLLAGAGSFLLANWFLTPPYGTFAVHDRSSVVDLVVFLLGALVVSVTVELGARRRAAAERDRLESRLVTRFSAAEQSATGVGEILAQVRALFSMTTVALVNGDGETVASVGPAPAGRPALRVPAADGLTLAAYGVDVFAEDRRLLHVLAGSAARAWQSQRLAVAAARADELAQTDRVRAALLAAVSHDLRTPIAGIKAAASGLRRPGMEWDPGEEDELLASVEEGADRLADLVDNLLAMSRVQAGALSVHPRAVALDEVVGRALLSTGSHGVEVAVPEDLPAAWVDPGLLERVIANLITNALQWAPAGEPVRIVACEQDGGLLVQVVDRGPGVAAARWEEMFTPFQRLDDTATGGVGLGLAIARGLTEALGGTLTPAHTQGGGLTMNVSVPAAR